MWYYRDQITSESIMPRAITLIHLCTAKNDGDVRKSRIDLLVTAADELMWPEASRWALQQPDK